jgi:phage terminase large subunit-like protein
MAERLNKTQQRNKCKFDPLYLSEMLGYDFHLVDHGLELLRSVGPDITESDKLGEPNPLFELSDMKNRMVLWSRGHFKTSAVVLKIVQVILAFPDIRILLMQATVKNTKGLLREVKSHFNGMNQMSKLPTLFPEFCNTDTRMGTAEGFVTPARKRTHLKEWTVGVASPKSVKTGQHYDMMFADDLVNDQNFRSKEQQEKTIEDFKNYTPLIEPGGYKTVTGTRYTFADLYGHIIRQDAERREWNINIKTCWKDGSRANGPLFPQVKTPDGRTIGFTAELLDRIKTDDPAIFSCQYLNEPLIAGTQLFTEELLMKACKMYAREQYPLLGPATLFLDLGGHKRDNDPSVVVCGRLDSFGQMYVCDIRSGTKSQLDLAHTTIEMALIHRPLTVQVEGTAAGNYFIEYLKMVAASKGVVLQIMPLKVSNVKDAKDLRISAIEGVIRMKRLYFLFGLPKWEGIVEEFTQWPRGRHDDHIDTIGLMVQYYTQNVDMFSIRPVQSFHQFIVRSEPTTLITETFKEVSDEESCGGFLS